MKDEILSHNTYRWLFMYNLGLNRLHVLFFFFLNLSIIFIFHVIESMILMIITNKIEKYPFLLCGCRNYICFYANIFCQSD